MDARRFWMFAAAFAFGLWALLHALALLGMNYDGQIIFYSAMASVLVICVPAFLVTGQRSEAREKWGLTSKIAVALVAYVFANGLIAMSPAQRRELVEEGEVSLWHGEKDITIGQARFMTAFPLPFFAVAAVGIWVRLRRERAALEGGG